MPDQAAFYARIVDELRRDLKDLEEGSIQRRGAVLQSLMKLKQIYNHPGLLTGDGNFAPQLSGKMRRLGEIAEEIASRQEKLLVFTQFRTMTEVLAQFLARVFGRPGAVLHGDTPIIMRRQLVEQFQSANGPPFFILSLKAGGTGLTLTAASHVVHFDRWWNPAVEDQATDRAYRIGQRRNVLVHKFSCAGTLEARIADLLHSKRAIARDLLPGDGASELDMTSLSDDDLLRLVSLDLTQAAAECEGNEV
jgi:non-specific serine/threonine protein kinase